MVIFTKHADYYDLSTSFIKENHENENHENERYM